MTPGHEDNLEPRFYNLYCAGLRALQRAQVPFLVGGAYALACHTGIVRHTKISISLVDPGTVSESSRSSRRGLPNRDHRSMLARQGILGEKNSSTRFSAPATPSPRSMTCWFDHAIDAKIFGLRPSKSCPPEETICSKAFVMERERYDGAGVAPSPARLRRSPRLEALVRPFDSHWRVLFSHLILFGFIYPTERGRIPPFVMHTLLDRLEGEIQVACDPRAALPRHAAVQSARRQNLKHCGYQDDGSCC